MCPDDELSFYTTLMIHPGKLKTWAVPIPGEWIELLTQQCDLHLSVLECTQAIIFEDILINDGTSDIERLVIGNRSVPIVRYGAASEKRPDVEYEHYRFRDPDDYYRTECLDPTKKKPFEGGVRGPLFSSGKPRHINYGMEELEFFDVDKRMCYEEAGQWYFKTDESTHSQGTASVMNTTLPGNNIFPTVVTEAEIKTFPKVAARHRTYDNDGWVIDFCNSEMWENPTKVYITYYTTNGCLLRKKDDTDLTYTENMLFMPTIDVKLTFKLNHYKVGTEHSFPLYQWFERHGLSRGKYFSKMNMISNDPRQQMRGFSVPTCKPTRTHAEPGENAPPPGAFFDPAKDIDQFSPDDTDGIGPKEESDEAGRASKRPRRSACGPFLGLGGGE